MSYIFTSESVGEGHPDKVCDQVSDAVLDACLKQDKNSRVACETMVKDNNLFLAGEISTLAKVDFEGVARDVVNNIGYNNDDLGFSGESLKFYNFLSEQSPDIAQGVNEGAGLDKEQGAGDQGLMFGYACRETDVLMPLPIHLSHLLVKKQAELRRQGTDWLRPDVKSQVSVEYDQNFKNLERVSFSTDLTENNFTKIKEMSEKLDAHTLLLFWQFTIETMDEVNIVNDPNLSVEMFLIRLLYLKGNQTKTDNPAPNQNNKIDNNFEKKKIVVNQLKSSSQEKQKKILEENKSLNNLEIKSFNDLVDICNSKKEVELKYELETNVNLINFKNGYIEISFNENLKKDFVKILSSKLYEWTNTRWIISLSQNKGQETIKKTSEGEKKSNLKDFEQTDIFNNIKNSFPDAELIDVKDNKDD